MAFSLMGFRPKRAPGKTKGERTVSHRTARNASTACHASGTLCWKASTLRRCNSCFMRSAGMTHRACRYRHAGLARNVVPLHEPEHAGALGRDSQNAPCEPNERRRACTLEARNDIGGMYRLPWIKLKLALIPRDLLECSRLISDAEHLCPLCYVARVAAFAQELLRVIPSLPGISEQNFGVCTDGEQPLSALKAVFVAPALMPAGRNITCRPALIFQRSRKRRYGGDFLELSGPCENSLER